MNLRQIETALAFFTLAILVIYFPLETLASWPKNGLWNPFYLIDLIAMALLFAGALHSLRRRPAPAPGLLCGAWGWTAANAWRATFDRVFELSAGRPIPFGASEVWCVGIATIMALTCFGLSVFLVGRQNPRG